MSLGLHLLVILLFAGVLMPHMRQEKRPVYIVDLVNLPVANPQAGRPDARPAAKKPESKPQPAPVAAKPAPKPEPKPVPKVEPKPQPKPQPAAKPAPKPAAKPAAKPQPKADYQDTLSAIDKLKRQQEIDRLKQTLAAMQTNDERQSSAVKAPLGEEKGTGTEEGVAYDTWLHQFLKDAWALSKYQVSRPDLEARVLIIFDARGYLKDYRFLKHSGEDRFDDSVAQAIRKLDRLPNPPGNPLEKTVVFNLKELME